MVRKLKFHEQKLLKKVDFISWETDKNLHENKVMRRYHMKKREEYTLYNRLSREVSCCSMPSLVDPSFPVADPRRRSSREGTARRRSLPIGVHRRTADEAVRPGSGAEQGHARAMRRCQRLRLLSVGDCIGTDGCSILFMLQEASARPDGQVEDV